MSTQKRKFELFSRLQAMGFTYEEAVKLRRVEMTLQRWAEMECGDSKSYASTAIERDEATGKPYRVTMPHHLKPLLRIMKYRITNQRQLRRAFWNEFPHLRRNPFPHLSPRRKLSGHDYPCDTQLAFCDWIDTLARGDSISEQLAQRATL